MLECGNSQEFITELWLKLGCRVELPEEECAFFGEKGPQTGAFADQRQYLRYNYREKGLLIHRDVSYAIYTKDISHSSIGFLHTKQLFPLEPVRVYLCNGVKLDATIQRCIRLRDNCYECGGKIEESCRLNARQLRGLLLETQ
jgi:hypothetical protein